MSDVPYVHPCEHAGRVRLCWSSSAFGKSAFVHQRHRFAGSSSCLPSVPARGNIQARFKMRAVVRMQLEQGGDLRMRRGGKFWEEPYAMTGTSQEKDLTVDERTPRSVASGCDASLWTGRAWTSGHCSCLEVFRPRQLVFDDSARCAPVAFHFPPVRLGFLSAVFEKHWVMSSPSSRPSGVVQWGKVGITKYVSHSSDIAGRALIPTADPFLTYV